MRFRVLLVNDKDILLFEASSEQLFYAEHVYYYLQELIKGNDHTLSLMKKDKILKQTTSLYSSVIKEEKKS